MLTVLDVRRLAQQRQLHGARAASCFLALVVAGAAVQTWPAASIAAAIVAVAAVGSLIVPRALLPAAAIASFVLIPVKQLPFPGEPGTLNPGMVLVIIWCARLLPDMLSHKADGARPRHAATLSLLAGVTLLSAMHSGLATRSLAWAFSFVILGLLPVYLFQIDQRAGRIVIFAWIYLGAVLACYAIVEHVAGSNPLDTFYASARPPLLQVWATYRVTTTIGHPLVNASFFGIAAIMSIAQFLGSRQPKMLVCGSLSLLAVAATASRGAVLAVAVALFCVIVANGMDSIKGGKSWLTIIVTVAVPALVLIASAGTLRERNGSAEGVSSAQSRSQTLREGFRIIGGAPLLGVGPGVADDHKRATSIEKSRDIGLENSWLGLIASIGIPGALAAGGLLLVSLRTAVRERRTLQLGALVAYLVLASSFKLLEGHQPAIVMFGVVVGLCYVDAGRPKAEPAKSILQRHSR